jgi:hypothetical protein
MEQDVVPSPILNRFYLPQNELKDGIVLSRDSTFQKKEFHQKIAFQIDQKKARIVLLQKMCNKEIRLHFLFQNDFEK